MEPDVELYIGTIVLFAANQYPLADYHPCNGALLSVAHYQALFSLIGTRYGGDGVTTFAVPNLPAPLDGMEYIIALSGIYPPMAS